jgi:hypothetical protein
MIEVVLGPRKADVDLNPHRAKRHFGVRQGCQRALHERRDVLVISRAESMKDIPIHIDGGSENPHCFATPVGRAKLDLLQAVSHHRPS